MNFSAVDLSVWIIVLGCLCLNYSKIIQIYDVYRMAMYRAPSHLRLQTT